MKLNFRYFTVTLIVTVLFMSLLPLLSKKPIQEQIKSKSKNGDLTEVLKEGNQRFVSGSLTQYDFIKQRENLIKGQQPHTIVVTCSDSRVAPEYIFNQGLGHLFVIRVAGNVIDPVCLGSIEYAAEHLHSENLLVMGHSSCGAVKAALAGGEVESPNLAEIIKLIEPSVEYAHHLKLGEAETEKEAITQNVKNQIINIMKSKVIRELVKNKKLDINGGVYDLKSGNVLFINMNKN